MIFNPIYRVAQKSKPLHGFCHALVNKVVCVCVSQKLYQSVRIKLVAVGFECHTST